MLLGVLGHAGISPYKPEGVELRSRGGGTPFEAGLKKNSDFLTARVFHPSSGSCGRLLKSDPLFDSSSPPKRHKAGLTML